MTDEINTPEAPKTETIEHESEDPRDGTEFRMTFRVSPNSGKIEWRIEWTENGRECARNGLTDEISDEHGAVMYRNEPIINGARTPGSKLPEAKLDQLRDDLEAVKEYRAAVEETERAAPLTFRVVEHEYRMSDWPTSDLALVPRKTRLTDDERALVAETRDLAGAAGLGDDGHPKAFGDMDEGDELTADELREHLDAEFVDEQEERDAQHEREAARQELKADHAELHRVSFDPEEVREGLDKAATVGHPVTVATDAAGCNGEVAECSTDILKARATPQGEIDILRTHTY